MYLSFPYTQYAGLGLSFLATFYPAYKYGKEPSKLFLSFLLQVGVHTVTNELHSQDKISDFTKNVVEYASGSFTFCTSYHSFRDVITNSDSLKNLIESQSLLTIDPHDIALSFSFGWIPLNSIFSANELSKVILNNLHGNETHKLGEPLDGIKLGAKYTVGMLVKYQTGLHLPEDTPTFVKLAYTPRFFISGGLQGVAVNSLDQLAEPYNFTSIEFVNKTVSAFYADGISHTLYSTIAEAAYGMPSYQSWIKHYPATHYFPISLVIEETNLALKEFVIPGITNSTINYFEEVLVSNATHTEL
jgi:hypothetical protein